MRSKPDVTIQRPTIMSGLYLVATPIGNLGDLSMRTIEILQTVDVIACEDTRITSKILNKYAVKTKKITYHEHSAERTRLTLINMISSGKSVALVSDAGTPIISDPGFKLVRECIKKNFNITAIPGANAAITGLILSGLPANRFMFVGFLSSKKSQRDKELAELSCVQTTLIFYESTRRLVTTLRSMLAFLGDRPAAVARELTKRHEEIRRESISLLLDYYHGIAPPKGEIVIVVGPPLKKNNLSNSDLDALILKQLQTLSVRDTTAKLAFDTKLPKRHIYSRAIKLFKSQS